MTSIKTGADIDTFCSRCDLTLAHIVVAMDKTKVVRVQCKTCKTVHAYRSGEKTRSPRSSEPRSTSNASARDYDKVMAGKDLSRAKRYDAKTTFAEGEIVDHKLFGLGLIVKVLSDGKIDVVFRIGSKVLVHAR
jgi:hypothetical protein